MEKCEDNECSQYDRTEDNNCKRYYDIKQVPASMCLKAKTESVADVLCNVGLVAPVEGMDNVENFICWMIDHCERDIISEEGLQRTYAGFLKWHQQKGN